MKRTSLSLVIWGIILISFGGLALRHDHFNMSVNGVRKVVSPQNNPNLYWGVCLVPLFIGAVLCVAGVYLMRRKEKDNNPKSGLKRRILWNLVIWGVLLIAFGVQPLMYGHFDFLTGQTREMITRQNHPATYWMICMVPLLIGTAFFAGGVYLLRKKDNQQ